MCSAPTVHDVAPGFAPAFICLRAIQMTDYGFLQTVDTMLALYKLSDTLAPVYVATPDDGRGVRYKSYVEGVRKPSRRLTVADKVAAEARRWGWPA